MASTSNPYPPYRLPESDAFLYSTNWNEDIKNLFTKEVEVSRMKTIAVCLEEGYEAKLKGQKITTCPYSLKSLKSRDRRAWWHKGFCKKIETIPTEFNRQKNSRSLNLSFMGK